MDGLTFSALSADAASFVGLFAAPIVLTGTVWMGRRIIRGLRLFIRG